MDQKLNTPSLALRLGIGLTATLAAAGFYDVAVRDVVMSIAAFTLARLAEVRQEALSHSFGAIAHASH